MKRLIYQVYVGKPSRLYDTCVQSVKDYCESYNIDHIVQRTPILRIKPDVFATNRNPRAWEQYGGFLPIYEKENAFDYFDRYDQICIVDADIYIRPSSPNIFEALDPNVDFAGVIEREMPLDSHYLSKMSNYSNEQYSSLHSQQINFNPNQLGFEYYNMGLMLMNKSIKKYFKNNETAKQFITRSEFKDFVDGKGSWKWSTDQTLLNYWIRKEKMKLQKLDWKWNALFNGVKNECIKEANFIHFFKRQSLPNNGENINELLKLI